MFRGSLESQRLQYALADRAKALGFHRVEIIDCDLGVSAGPGAQARESFKQLLASVALGDVGIVLSRELSRLSRTDKDGVTYWSCVSFSMPSSLMPTTSMISTD
ncbi:MAG: recombinase family protein [Gammaproteobacteria bacterium]